VSRPNVARRLIEEVRREVTRGQVAEYEQTWNAIRGKYRLGVQPLESMVSLVANENWIEFKLRYIVDYRQRRTARDSLFQRILDRYHRPAGRDDRSRRRCSQRGHARARGCGTPCARARRGAMEREYRRAPTGIVSTTALGPGSLGGHRMVPSTAAQVAPVAGRIGYMTDKKAAARSAGVKSKKASSRVTAAKRTAAAAAAAASRRARRQAIGQAAIEKVARRQFQKTRTRAIQAHVSARGRRRQARRDSR
jgi:hypothetical protein